jgi:predicted phage tail protein
MEGMRPRTLLFVMVSVVPVIVALAFVVAVLLQRAGFGWVVWALLPFAASMVVIGVLGVLLGRAATRSTPDGRRSGKDDGV